MNSETVIPLILFVLIGVLLYIGWIFKRSMFVARVLRIDPVFDVAQKDLDRDAMNELFRERLEQRLKEITFAVMRFVREYVDTHPGHNPVVGNGNVESFFFGQDIHVLELSMSPERQITTIALLKGDDEETGEKIVLEFPQPIPRDLFEDIKNFEKVVDILGVQWVPVPEAVEGSQR